MGQVSPKNGRSSSEPEKLSVYHLTALRGASRIPVHVGTCDGAVDHGGGLTTCVELKLTCGHRGQRK